MIKTKYEPLEDRVVIRPIKKTESIKSEGGIILDQIKKEVAEGEVIATGNGFTARDTGVFIPTVLHAGDVVLYGINAGMPIDIPKEEGGFDECRLMREGDVLLLISNKDN